MKLIVLILSFLLFHANVTQAQKKQSTDKIEEEMGRCLEKKENQTTAGMCDCTYKALDKWDEKLNATYKTLLAKLDADAKGKLVEAQRQWIKFKEKEIVLIDATIGVAPGTLSRVVRANSVMEITRERAVALESLSAIVDEL